MRITRSQSNRCAAEPSSSGLQGSPNATARRGRKARKLVPEEDSAAKVEKDLLQSQNNLTVEVSQKKAAIKQCTSRKTKGNIVADIKEMEAVNIQHDAAELDWEEGAVSSSKFEEGYSFDLGKTLTVEFNESQSKKEKKASRRASAKEKEIAELAHRVQLLCSLARGRIVDKACYDPLIQASILSILPSNFQTISHVTKLTAANLEPLAIWFQRNFHVTTESSCTGSFESKLASALQNQEGTIEEVAALSVALFRALNLTARFVSILDVASIKPDINGSTARKQDVPQLDTKGVTLTTGASPFQSVSSPSSVHTQCETASTLSKRKRDDALVPNCKKNLTKSLSGSTLNVGTASTSCSEECTVTGKSPGHAEGSKRKGDVEFELQMEMALSATAAEARNVTPDANLAIDTPSSISPFKRMRQMKVKDSSASGSSAVWSRIGPPLCWAEVYCSGETLTGRWVHVDAANGIVDGEDKVEAAAAVHRKSLSYVVAFAGNGGKDVTRRYCKQWYKIASKRTNSEWWEDVLAPLRELEMAATGTVPQFRGSHKKSSPHFDKIVRDDCSISEFGCTESVHVASQNLSSDISYRSNLEDVELATRSLTEPLPTNQQAYKTHHLYALEKWLNKNQVLHPKGPLLGYCGGNPVYPRSCVQTLQTRQRCLRDGLQVKASEVPAKVVSRSNKAANAQKSELSDVEEESTEPTIELYGRWQLEPLQLPCAVDGIVPKNDHGNVEVWSEKCLPPGTVHLKLPRLVPIARRLQIDFAPALVGFEFRSGKSYPVFDGIVVCAEFKDAIMEAHAEEEERREEEERKRDEVGALSRWFQLFSSIVTRQRLQASYGNPSSAHEPGCSTATQERENADSMISSGHHRLGEWKPELPCDDHVHTFPAENESYDEELSVRTKRCPCGFSIQVEEL